MNVEELLDLMEETLEAGTAVPFAPAKRVVDVDRMRDIIDEVRNNLPDEIRESKKIVNDREQIMKNAQVESETIIQKAEERASALVSEQEIVKRSRQRAAEILTAANTQAKHADCAGRHGHFAACHFGPAAQRLDPGHQPEEHDQFAG